MKTINVPQEVINQTLLKGNDLRLEHIEIPSGTNFEIEVTETKEKINVTSVYTININDNKVTNVILS